MGCSRSESASKAAWAVIGMIALLGCSDGGGGGPVWAKHTDLPAARQENAVVAVNGEIWVLGGFDESGDIVADVDIYDPISSDWRTGPALPAPLHHGNVAVVDDVVFVLGGLSGNSFTAFGEGWRFDGDDWAAVTPLPVPRGGGAVTVRDRSIYVAGGFAGGAVADVHAYDVDADSWSALPSLPDARDHVVAGVVDGTIYVVGGRDGAIDAVRPDVFAHTPGDTGWVSRAPMPVARAGCAAATVDGRIYVFGGEGNPDAETGVFEEASAYDPASDSWAELEPMPTPRHGTGGAAVRGIIHIPGGATKAAFGAVRTHEAYSP